MSSYSFWGLSGLERRTTHLCRDVWQEYREATAQKEIRFGDPARESRQRQIEWDQFNVYVANRFVVPSLTAEQQSQMSTGLLTLDVLTRQFIHQYFQYQYLIVDHSKEAFAIERLCQAGYIFNQKPYLNPIAPSPSVSDRQILQAFLDQKLC